MKVAITGKGGVGKTTITAILSRTLARSGESVVAVDADPNPNLAIALGLGVDGASRVEGVVNVLLEEKAAHSHEHDHSDCETQPETVEDLLDDLGVWAPDGVRLIQTGRIERPAEGCLCCGSHRTSRRIFDELDRRGRVVVADLEAGVNDLLWVWPKAEDVVLLVTEPYSKSIEVARRAFDITQELGVARMLIIANRLQNADEAGQIRAAFPDSVVLEVPEDPAIMKAAAVGRSPLDAAGTSPAVEAVSTIAVRIAGLARAGADALPAYD